MHVITAFLLLACIYCFIILLTMFRLIDINNSMEQGLLVLYQEEAAGAQYIADTISRFKRHPRMLVSHHLHMHRKVVGGSIHSSGGSGGGGGRGISDRSNGASTSSNNNNGPSAVFMAPTVAHMRSNTVIGGSGVGGVGGGVAWYPEQTLRVGESIQVVVGGGVGEVRGMSEDNSYIALVARDRVVLAHVKSSVDADRLLVSLVWSCPLTSVEELFCDTQVSCLLLVVW